MPVMIYNNPVSYGVDITPAMLGELADDPLFVAIKESSDDVRRVTQIFNAVGDRFQVFTGVDNLAARKHGGGCGRLGRGPCLRLPRRDSRDLRLMQQGRTAEALAIYRWFQPLLDLDVSSRLVQNIKLVEALVTGSNDRCRAPRMALIGAERAAVEAIVAKAMAKRPSLPALRAAAE